MQLSDNKAGRLIKAMSAYVFAGEEPTLVGVLAVAWPTIRAILTSDISNRVSGKNGGARKDLPPSDESEKGGKGKKNTPLSADDLPPSDESEKGGGKKIGTNVNVNVNENENEKVNGGSAGETSETEIAPDGAETPPPLIYNVIKERLLALGVVIDDKAARDIYAAHPHDTWYTASYNFLDFSFDRVKKQYPGKPDEERKLILLSALTKWPELDKDYERKRKTAEAAQAKEAARAARKAKEALPEQCPHCGAALGGHRICPGCGAQVYYDRERQEWTHTLGEDVEASLAPEGQAFLARIKERGAG
jgi:ribosomal protein L32